MAVYVFGVTASDVASAIAWSGSIDADAEPSSARLSDVISQFAAEIGCALESVSITPSDVDTGSNLHAAMAGSLTRRCAAEWVMANTRESDEYTAQAVEAFGALLGRIRAGSLGDIGTDPRPGSRVKGVFNSQTQVTQPASRSSRIGLWRKGTGFN